MRAYHGGWRGGRPGGRPHPPTGVRFTYYLSFPPDGSERTSNPARDDAGRRGGELRVERAQVRLGVGPGRENVRVVAEHAREDVLSQPSRHGVVRPRPGLIGGDDGGRGAVPRSRPARWCRAHSARGRGPRGGRGAASRGGTSAARGGGRRGCGRPRGAGQRQHVWITASSREPSCRVGLQARSTTRRKVLF